MSAVSSRSTRSRCARASRATSTRCTSRTARSSSRATSCSPSTSGRSRTPSTRRARTCETAKSNVAFTQADLARGQQLLRDKHHQRADLRAAGAGGPQCPVCGGGERGDGPPGRARSRVHRVAGAGHRPHRRPARNARQSGHRRHRRHHHAARHHRVDRSDPLRIHLRRERRCCATSGWQPAARAT